MDPMILAGHAALVILVFVSAAAANLIVAYFGDNRFAAALLTAVIFAAAFNLFRVSEFAVNLPVPVDAAQSPPKA